MATRPPTISAGDGTSSAKKEEGHCLPWREERWRGRVGDALSPLRCDTNGGVAADPALEVGSADTLTWIPLLHSDCTTSAVLSSAGKARRTK